MRTVATLPHPDFKITVFNMNQKFIIKFEQGLLEQSYKLSEMDLSDGVNSIFQILDDTFLENVNSCFQTMRSAFNEAYKRHE